MATITSKIYIPELRRTIEASLNSYEKILPNFAVSEIANNKASEIVKLEIPDERAWRLLHMMQITRDNYGEMIINSAYRTPTFNKSIGGDANSCHLRCWAFDWAKSNQTEAKRKDTADWWKALCKSFGEIGAINFYTNGYHCEIGSDVRFKAASFTVRDYRGKKGDW